MKKILHQHFPQCPMAAISHFIYFTILRRMPYGGDNFLHLSFSVWFMYFLHWDFNCQLKTGSSYLWKVLFDKKFSPGFCTHLFEHFNAFINCSGFFTSPLANLKVLKFFPSSIFSLISLNHNNSWYILQSGSLYINSIDYFILFWMGFWTGIMLHLSTLS